jgi:hypothetical protein
VTDLLVNMREALGRIRELEVALDESVKLQSHYAVLLNIHDGGKRRTFENAEAWLARLRELKARASGVAQG